MMHWTQDPKNKAKLRRLHLKGTKSKRAKNKAKLKAIDKVSTKSLVGRALAKTEINDLARRGAQQRIVELEKELVKLRMFVGAPE